MTTEIRCLEMGAAAVAPKKLDGLAAEELQPHLMSELIFEETEMCTTQVPLSVTMEIMFQEMAVAVLV